MGGGDLNTKKSWHPNTMKNQERVWKAEQAEANEKRRIDDLRREMDSERSREELTIHGQASGVLSENTSKKMDWMYKQPQESVDREQYLLGKKIDKTFEKIISEEKANQSYVKPPPKNHVEHECIPFSIRNLSTDVAPNDCQVDMARKLLEDPLVAIRKRELESRAQLLQNPVKLKELTMLLKMDQAHKKKKKEKKKLKKHKRESSDIDKQLAEKLSKLKNANEDNFDIKGLLQSPKSFKTKSEKKKKRKKSSKDSDSEDEEIKHNEKHENRKRTSSDTKNRDKIEKKKCRYDKRDKSEKSHKSSRERHQEYSKSISKSKYEDDSVLPTRSSISISHRRYNDDSDEDGEKPRQKNYGLVRADGSKIHLSKTEKHIPTKVVSGKDAKKFEKVRPVRLTEAEKEEKRNEMMENANKRDKEREKYVSHYRDQEKKQEAKEKNQKYKDDFVEKHLREAAKFTSVESRIKSNIYNIQRSNRHMDTNFAKR